MLKLLITAIRIAGQLVAITGETILRLGHRLTKLSYWLDDRQGEAQQHENSNNTRV